MIPLCTVQGNSASSVRFSVNNFISSLFSYDFLRQFDKLIDHDIVHIYLS